ncbi:MAG: hypothetical protein V9G20_21180 [Candidatus Promineifilaceae bacterium]
MVEMLIHVPETLAEELEAAQDRLPEILEYGLEAVSPVPATIYQYILEFLGSQPTPEQLLDFGPTPEMQARASFLLEKNREGALTELENRELDEYVKINHLVIMLKGGALSFLTGQDNVN